MNIKKFAIIVAGGSGTRMKSPLPKQFLDLNGLPILMHTINAFFNYDKAVEIIVVLPQNDISLWNQLCAKHSFTVPLKIANGGSSRFESVKNGLNTIKVNDCLVAVHDGVRPLVSHQLIHHAYSKTQQYGNAIPAIPLKDSIRIVDGENSKAVDRKDYKLIQTPQTFKMTVLRKAYKLAANDNFTDDASVVEAAGETLHLIEGENRNIKITTTEDLHIASYLQKSMA